MAGCIHRRLFAEHLETDVVRGISALGLGALVGAVFIPAVVILLNFPTIIRGSLVGLVGFIFVCSFVVWLFGLTFLAMPIWILMDRLKLRSIWSAMLLGATLCFAVAFVWDTRFFGLLLSTERVSVGGRLLIADGRLTLSGWRKAVELGLLLALQGSIVGAIVWRWAYRRRSA
ncbi:MAG: hypothetical protein J0H54_05680 [Rhizobiales bacterium]|nr:hypothetical protein [Hyphomicrobiales bacterium]